MIAVKGVSKKNEVNIEKEKVTLVDYITNLYNETTTTTVNNIAYSLDENHLLMNDRLGSNDVFKLDGNIRYYGKNPNNYVDIGDRDSQGNIIFWRIIGVFKDIEVTDEEGNVIKVEDLVKIIRSDKLTAGDVDWFAWDYKYDGTTGSFSIDWKEATLNTMLNNAYYNSNTTIYYEGNLYIHAPNTIELDFKSTGLSDEVHNKIERVIWNLDGHTKNDVYTNSMYVYERTKNNLWSGKIALINVSDYGYSADLSSCQQLLKSYDDSMCTSTNWMNDSTIGHQWTLIPDTWTSETYTSNGMYYVGRTGGVWTTDAVASGSVRPVMYLKSDISIVEEKETREGLKYFVVK